MNFFKSMFADEPDPESEALASRYEAEGSNDEDSATESEPESGSASDAVKSNPNSESAPLESSSWDFGGLVKTFASKSESLIDAYKSDLQEFSTGLKAETALLREVANRAVKELPKAGALTFDELKTTVLKGTTQIISQGKEALMSLDQEISWPTARSGNSTSFSYNRFDAKLRAIQIDKATYCLVPEDLDDYEKWKSGFVLEEKGEELGKLFAENAAMENMYHKIVPSEIDPETFWYRYFYKVHKLKQAEEVRASFLKKAIDDEEEELSWDVDEDDEEEEEEDIGSDGWKGGESRKVREAAASENEKNLENCEAWKENVKAEVKNDSGSDLVVSKEAAKVDDVVMELQEEDSGKIKEEVVETRIVDVKEKVGENGANEENEPERPTVQSQKEDQVMSNESALKPKEGTATGEDLEWDEIEDEGSDGEQTVAPRKSEDKAELQKHLSTAVEDEDLSWDIEDDDEPVRH